MNIFYIRIKLFLLFSNIVCLEIIEIVFFKFIQISLSHIIFASVANIWKKMIINLFLFSGYI